tara:strand:+ start:434600 stop:434818 length:219 start_codon:yes stop_codon:yes gene_type:complete
MMASRKSVRAEVSFQEYKEASASGIYGDKTKDELLMQMFSERGIEIGADGKPTQPAVIVTDVANQAFVLVQG